VTYELSNECWNFGFVQAGDTFYAWQRDLAGDSARGFKYYGYRAAACMKMFATSTGIPARWRGSTATQTVNPAVTNYALAGATNGLKNDLSPANSLRVSDLFASLYVTGYFGDAYFEHGSIGDYTGKSGIVTSKHHGYSDGQTLIMWMATGMTQLNKKKVTITKIDRRQLLVGCGY